MSDSVDRVFVHALNTVKRIPRTGSARPPLADRLKLYGLYKQSTEGDVDGITSRPRGDSEEVRSDQEKWDAWFDQKGFTRTEAKRQYISTLIGTMHRYASQTRDARELVSELEFVWDQIKSNPPSSSGSNSYPQPQGSGESPNSGRDRLIYPVMSEGGARTPGNSGKHLQTLEPMSQPSSEGQEEEEQEAVEDLEAGRDQFVDAQDSHADGTSGDSASSDEAVEQEPPARSFSRDARAIIAPISNYLKSQRTAPPQPPEETTSKWQRRIESALIKMNAEIAALREQLDMQQEAAMQSSSILPAFQRNKRQSFIGWLLSSIWSTASGIIKHIVIDAAILAALTLVMRWRGIPAERLENLVLGWIGSIRKVTFVKQVERQVARGELRVPSAVARSMPFQASRTGPAG